MDWIEEVKIRIKRKNEILFSLNSEFLRDLNDLLKKTKPYRRNRMGNSIGTGNGRLAVR